MGNSLELYEARVSYLQFVNQSVEIHFSYACIHKFMGQAGRDTGKSWSQEVVLSLQDAQLVAPMPPLPNVVLDGYLEVDGDRYELIPLPFERVSPASLHLEFSDESVLEVYGKYPLIKLLGEKVFL